MGTLALTTGTRGTIEARGISDKFGLTVRAIRAALQETSHIEEFYLAVERAGEKATTEIQIDTGSANPADFLIVAALERELGVQVTTAEERRAHGCTAPANRMSWGVRDLNGCFPHNCLAFSVEAWDAPFAQARLFGEGRPRLGGMRAKEAFAARPMYPEERIGFLGSAWNYRSSSNIEFLHARVRHLPTSSRAVRILDAVISFGGHRSRPRVPGQMEVFSGMLRDLAREMGWTTPILHFLDEPGDVY